MRARRKNVVWTSIVICVTFGLFDMFLRTTIVICATFGLFDIFVKFLAQVDELSVDEQRQWRLFHSRGGGNYSRGGLLNYSVDLVNQFNVKPASNLFQPFQDKRPSRKKRQIKTIPEEPTLPSKETFKIVRTGPPVEHISFLKVHMAGSTPIQLMLFRYGHERNLSFVLPSKGHYFTKSTARPEPILPPRFGTHYDIVCNHACFNYTLYSSLMPDDTVYLAIVRDPYTQFLNSYYYYLRFFNFPYLKSIPTPAIENLIRNPEKYDEGSLSYTMNSMSRDFGFQTSHFNDFYSKSGISGATAYLESIAKAFDLVLVYEKYEESLILLKRRLRWSLKSILFMPEKEDNPEMRIGGSLLDAFKRRNRLDYLLYDYFSKVLDEKIREAGPSLEEETINYKLTLKTVRMWCDYEYFGKLSLPATKWNEKFDITSRDCDLIAKSEFDYLDLLKGTTG